ncbi:hypothetical protein HanPI659440_Chr15g0601521 [Helianthus annuus]|nr:hypothetical protein HanPI659440_Chr15g0601521 [Helianthus annuus]
MESQTLREEVHDPCLSKSTSIDQKGGRLQQSIRKFMILKLYSTILHRFLGFLC